MNTEQPTGMDSQLISAATSLVPSLRVNAETSERARQLTRDTVASLRNAGFFRLAKPRAYSGHRVGLPTALAVSEELGRGSSSVGWVTSIFYGGDLSVSLLDDKARQVIWGDDPDAVTCGSVGASCPASRVDGGVVLSGRWGWNSGVHHAGWALLDFTTEDQGAPRRGFAVAPVGELAIEDTWHMTGMRGTGSDAVTADDVFVSDDFILWLDRLARGEYRRDGDDEILTRVNLVAAVRLAYIGPLIGMAQAVYEYTTDRIVQGKPLVSAVKLHERTIDAPSVQAAVAEAAVLIDSARLQVHRAAEAIEQAAQYGVDLDVITKSRIRMDESLAARRLRRAVELLMDVGGAGGFAESSPTQRIWGDLEFASRHPAFAYELALELHGRLLLGVEVPPAALI